MTLLISISVNASATAGSGLWADWWSIAGIGAGIGISLPRRYIWLVGILTGLGAATAILWSGVPPLPSLLVGLSIGAGVAVAVRIIRGSSVQRPKLEGSAALKNLFLGAAAAGVTAGGLTFIIATLGGEGSEVIPLVLRTVAEMGGGILLVAPLAMRLPRARDTATATETLIIWGLTLIAIALVFGVNEWLPLGFITLAPLVWAAMRLPFRATMTMLVITATLISLLSALGRGPFSVARLGINLSEILVQTFDIILAIVFVTLGNVVATRKVLTDELAESQALAGDRVKREIERAAEVQRALLPRDETPVTGYEFAGICIPASSVGGDFYDWHVIPSGFALTLGDVMGKGVGAGMLAAAIRTAIRMGGRSMDASTVVERASDLLEPDLAESSSFATLFHARVSSVDGTFTYSDAGHGLSFLLSPDGTMTRLSGTDLPLGLSLGEPRVSDPAEMRPGDLLVSVSDGILDLWDGSLESIEEVAQIARMSSSPHNFVERIQQLAHLSMTPDDITVVAVKRQSSG